MVSEKGSQKYSSLGADCSPTAVKGVAAGADMLWLSSPMAGQATTLARYSP